MSQTDQPALSSTWADLLYQLHQGDSACSPQHNQGFHCDVLIVGSGYGGAVAAAALGETRRPDQSGPRVWLLERGQAYMPGEFPNQMADLAGHVRFNTPGDLDTKGRRNGLFDIRVGEDLGVVLANGLGGGSLINAGVMLWPQDEVFQQASWPRAIQHSLPALRALSATMQVRLGAATAPHQPNTIQRQEQGLSKFDALARINRSGRAADFQPTPITVAMRDGDLSSDGVKLQACIRCGDCATGCNHGAKISLDTNLLSYAARRGVRLFTGATVLRIEPVNPVMPNDEGWLVQVNHTEPQMQWQEGPSTSLRVRRVILAAGALGSTGILQRSASARFPLSPQLGEGFSGNGDLLMAAYKQHQPARAIANELTEPTSRDVGPTITAMIDRRRPASSLGDLHRGYVIQDLAVPGPLQRVVEEVTQTAFAVRQMTQMDCSTHQADDPGTDPLCIDPQHMLRTLPLAMIGHDQASGQIRLVQPEGVDPDLPEHPRRPPKLESDGAVTVRWPALRNDPRFDRQIDELDSLCQASRTGGTLLPNPLWKPLPAKLSTQRGPLLIAHPLGGCRMGEDSRSGVVDDIGRVFVPTTDDQAHCYSGLAVLDGAMIPSSLGINPSLAIATLSERAIDQLIHTWQLGPRQSDRGEARARPMLAPPALPSNQSTRIEITEQMRGWVGDYGIELTLRLKETPVSTLLQGRPFKRELPLNETDSFVRVIRRPAQIAHDSWDAGQATEVFKARLSGQLFALHREPSTPGKRLSRATAAWVANRGVRDISQLAVRFLTGNLLPGEDEADVGSVIGGMAVTLTHAGEVRLIDYDLVIAEVLHAADRWQDAQQNLIGQRIQGSKRITYACRGNPLKQLTEMGLNAFPRLDLAPIRHKTLTLDLAYLADMRIPLLRITRQRDLPTTLLDLGSLLALFARMLVRIHLHTLRAPDKDLFNRPPRPPALLPPSAAMPGLPAPEISWLATGPAVNARITPQVRLTRYPARPTGRARHPLVMLHGYSASGTSFAHPALSPGLAAYMWNEGHEVWVVDLRTSPGVPDTPTLPWTFEDVAHEDIPLALAHIADHSPTGQVNVFAHCMGSAMLWMAMLAPAPSLRRRPDQALAAIKRLQQPGGAPLIHRLCMSQVAPIIHFSDGNLLRTFALRYVRQYLPLGPYRFKPSDQELPTSKATNKAINDVLDQLLSALPYPGVEWPLENPLVPPWRTTTWTGTRRRMDLLYGRTFNLQMVSRKVLDHIDDLFGPMNLNTLSQVLHMARNRRLTDANGHSVYLSQRRLALAMDNLDAMMSVHGTQNGLSDIKGMYAFKDYVQTLGPAYSAKYTLRPIPELGHQDCLIGERAAHEVFGHVKAFFNEVPA